MNVVLGETAEEAKRKKAALDNALTLEQLLDAMARRTGISVPVLRDNLDRPFPVAELPSDEQLKNGIGWRKSVVDLAVSENLTVRELLIRAPSAHHHIVGTATAVADAMEERLAAQAADGFTMMVDVLPEGVDDIVNLLVPELQRRGLFHKEYNHRHLRDMLGLEGGTSQPKPRHGRELELSSMASANG
jgi:alkanesulfonate monooxygenase SsuD/methylene tetrahydromethanopterin reductase-like flavin-dependent oxidoreductase (luciferase family)